MGSTSYDVSYYAPAFTVTIGGSELEAEISKIITNITITKALNKQDEFKIQIKDELKGGKFHWQDNKLFKMGSEVSIELGYSGNMSQKVEGVVQNVDTRFTNDIPSTFTIQGVDKAFKLLAAKSEPQTYLKKDSDIVSTIAGTVGLSSKVDATKLTFEEKKKKGDTSYLEFIQTMVSQNADYEFMISEGKLVFRKADISSSAVATLTWGRTTNSFDPTMNLTQMITGVTVRAWDQKNKVKIEGTAKAGAEFTQEGGKSLGSTQAKKVYGDVIKIITDKPVDSAEEASEIALAHLIEATNQFIKAKIQTIGNPAITPGVCVEVEGINDWPDGKYYVEKAEHTIDADKYITSFEGRRNAS